MAPASATTVLAVPARPATERPEAKDPDASDGRFAGLMAQFIQAPPDPRSTPSNPPAAATAESRPARAETPGTGARAEVAPKGGQEAASRQIEDPKPGSPSPVPPAAPEGQSADTPALAPLPPAGPASQGPVPPAEAPPAAEGQVQTPSSAAPVSGPAGAPGLVDPAQPGSIAASGSKAALAVALAKVLPAKAGGPGIPPAATEADSQLPSIPPAASKAAPTEPAPAAPGAPVPGTGPGIPVPPVSKPLAKTGEGIPGEGVPEAQPPAPGTGNTQAAMADDPILKTALEALHTGSPSAPAGSLQPAMAAFEAAAGAAAAASVSKLQPVPAALPVQAPAAPAVVATPAAVVQVEGGLRWMLKGGTQEASLQLHPESLGQVTIHLKVEGGEVHARLWITEPSSVQTIQEGRPHLEQSLQEQGLQLGSFDLQQGHRPFQEMPSAPAFLEPPSAHGPAARQEAPVPVAPPVLNSHHVELYA